MSAWKLPIEHGRATRKTPSCHAETRICRQGSPAADASQHCLSTCHDWQSWLGTSSPEPPPESDVSFLCHQDGNDIRCRRVGPMAALTLEAASDSASLDEIVARVAETAGIDRPGEELAGKVRAQLRELYVADLVGVRCPE